MINRFSVPVLLVALGTGLSWIVVHEQLTNSAQAQEKIAPKAADAAPDKLDRTVLPIPEPKLTPITTLDARNAKAPPRFEVKAPGKAPNVLIVLIDDMGFGQASAFGGPIHMPALGKMAKGGLKYNQFHTTALCSPTRAALLTGRNHHICNMGSITGLLEAHHYRGRIQLLLGNFEEGLPEFEWRLLELTHLLPLAQQRWDGSVLAGHTILLQQEGGFGDTVQFIRYAQLVKQCGGRVLVMCDKALIPLLATCPGIDELVALDSPVPSFDVCAMMLSLPLLCRTVLSTIPAEIPYLRADSVRVERWRRRLGAIKALKIGIAWQGSPWAAKRSVDLAQFAPLGQLEEVRLFSLQKGAGAEQLAELASLFPATDLGIQLEDFADTAAVLKNLDLVITIDSVMSHCAGALGVPVWVVLQSVPDWRWVLEREDSPWYPSMRLFRQKQPGDWAEVFQRITAAVKRKLHPGQLGWTARVSGSVFKQ